MVLAGADGSAPSSDAVTCTAQEAEARSAVPGVVRCLARPVRLPSHTVLPKHVRDHFRASADGLVDAAVHRTRAVARNVDVSGPVVVGEPLTLLEEQCRAADPVVGGRRGRGGFTGLLPGSVGQAVPHRAHSPVAVVRG